MRARAEQSTAGESGETISEAEFRKLCDGIYRDRFEIYRFNPGADKREALLWMLTGCLISLLSVTDAELENLAGSRGQDTYADAIFALLQGRSSPPFDPRPCVEELLNETGTVQVESGGREI